MCSLMDLKGEQIGPRDPLISKMTIKRNQKCPVYLWAVEAQLIEVLNNRIRQLQPQLKLRNQVDTLASSFLNALEAEKIM